MEHNFSIGDKVLYQGYLVAVVKYSGHVYNNYELIFGIQLELPVGQCDGSLNGHQYFKCDPKYGLFTKPSQLHIFSKHQHAACQLQRVMRGMIQRRRIKQPSPINVKDAIPLFNRAKSSPVPQSRPTIARSSTSPRPLKTSSIITPDYGASVLRQSSHTKPAPPGRRPRRQVKRHSLQDIPDNISKFNAPFNPLEPFSIDENTKNSPPKSPPQSPIKSPPQSPIKSPPQSPIKSPQSPIKSSQSPPKSSQSPPKSSHLLTCLQSLKSSSQPLHSHNENLITSKYSSLPPYQSPPNENTPIHLDKPPTSPFQLNSPPKDNSESFPAPPPYSLPPTFSSDDFLPNFQSYTASKQDDTKEEKKDLEKIEPQHIAKSLAEDDLHQAIQARMISAIEDTIPSAEKAGVDINLIQEAKTLRLTLLEEKKAGDISKIKAEQTESPPKYQDKENTSAQVIQRVWNKYTTSVKSRNDALTKAWEKLELREDSIFAAAYKSPLTKHLLEKVKPKGRHARLASTEIAISKILATDKDFDASLDDVGPRLPSVLTREYCITMLNRFGEEKIMPAVDVIRVLMRLQPLLQVLPNIVIIPTRHKVTIVGDLHGQLDDLFTIFKMNGLPSEENCYLFNGDFVDRGPNGVEVALAIFLFKLLHPESVALNRGNHESRDLNEWGGFEDECVYKYNLAVFDMFQEVFACLPLATIVQDRIFVVHAGLFNEPISKEQVQALDRFHEVLPSNMPLEDMLWSDPCDEVGRHQNDRGAGIMFGPDVTQDFLDDWDLDLVVRSHEVKPGGFEAHHDDMLITCFSASNYCGVVGNHGAYLIFRDDAPPECVQYMATPKAKGKFSSHKRGHGKSSAAYSLQQDAIEEDLIRKLSTTIVEKRVRLLEFWRQFDKSYSGKISKALFSGGLAKVLEIDVPFSLLFDKFGVNFDSQQRVNYMQFLEKFRAQYARGASRDDIRMRRPSSDTGMIAHLERKLSETNIPPMPNFEDDMTISETTEMTTELTWEIDETLNEIPTRNATPSVSHVIEVLTDFIFQYRYSLKYLFKYLDSDGSGNISSHQFKEGIKALNTSLKEPLTDYQIERLLDYVDSEHKGHVSYEEFFRSFYVPSPMQQAFEPPIIKKWVKDDALESIDESAEELQ